MAKDNDKDKAAGAPVENPDAAALAKENEELKAKLAKAEAKSAKAGTGELSGPYLELYQAKVDAGLKPALALEATRAQMAHDKTLAAAKG